MTLLTPKETARHVFAHVAEAAGRIRPDLFESGNVVRDNFKILEGRITFVSRNNEPLFAYDLSHIVGDA